LGRKGFTLLPSPNAISPSGSVHDKLELELELLYYGGSSALMNAVWLSLPTAGERLLK
jgi:hypothetical protein